MTLFHYVFICNISMEVKSPLTLNMMAFWAFEIIYKMANVDSQDCTVNWKHLTSMLLDTL